MVALGIVVFILMCIIFGRGFRKAILIIVGGLLVLAFILSIIIMCSI